MPLEWSERFGLNVPIIKLGNNISNAEKIFGLGVLFYILETIKVRKSRVLMIRVSKLFKKKLKKSSDSF